MTAEERAEEVTLATRRQGTRREECPLSQLRQFYSCDGAPGQWGEGCSQCGVAWRIWLHLTRRRGIPIAVSGPHDAPEQQTTP